MQQGSLIPVFVKGESLGMRGLARRAPVEEDVALSVLNSVGIHRPHPGVVELKPGVTRAILCERHIVPTCQGGKCNNQVM